MSIKTCGQCKHYDAKDRYCMARHEVCIFGENSDFAMFCDKYGLPEPKTIKSAFLHEAESVPVVTERAESECTDAINPAHYTQGSIECIEALKAATVNLKGIEAVCTANAIKYLWRWKEKNGAVDWLKSIGIDLECDSDA